MVLPKRECENEPHLSQPAYLERRNDLALGALPMKQLQQLLRCRRGGVALMISAAAVPLFLMSALGAEVGSWHLIRRHAQNAADAAAYAGALAVTVGQNAITEGEAYAAKNGFCTTGVGCSAPMSGATQNVSVTLDA